ncbi:uncharacterized protein LOC129216418 [Uloborus diversus]|uniref:uncharacterized protein LOC129216418 n=1 Tax=Uloborus diversus TaxID=327109 RepID=UPI0024093F73|nr:uncharacterized protein LOC129216418 [Uloborus diversus]
MSVHGPEVRKITNKNLVFRLAYDTIPLSSDTMDVMWTKSKQNSQSKCRSGAMESFILSTSSLPVASSYKRHLGSSLIECTRSCLSDDHCQSFTFLKSQNGSECRMTSSAADSKKRMIDLTLTPTSGTYYMEKVCLKGACDRLFVAESLRGMELTNYNDRIISNVTRLSCIESCLNSKDLECRSVEFDSKTTECRLSRYDRFSRKSDFKKSTSASIEYLDVTCPYQLPEDVPAAEIVLLGNVEHPYSLIEYEGVTAAECSELCLRNILFPCRSFLSGQQDNKLYCGLTHQNREGLIQNPGSLLSSRSLNYYEITRSIEGCDTDDIKFELVSGATLNANSYTAASNLSPSECLEQCRNDKRCRSVSIDYQKHTCDFNSESIGHSLDVKLQQLGNFNYFEKVCLPGSQCKRDWAFERIQNKELVGIEQEKVLVEAYTKEECQAACIRYKDFLCLSAEFNYQLGECRLSPYNRFSSSEKTVTLSSTKFAGDYFENNCAKEPRGFCNSKLVKNLRLLLIDKLTVGGTIEDCRQDCYTTEEFTCRSVTFDSLYKTCGLSHHTRKSAHQDALIRTDNFEFLEVSTCFDVSVDCSEKIMLATVKTNSMFKGKVYAKGKPLTCSMDVRNSLEFQLPIPLTGPDCGTTSEEEGKFSNVLVIQSNDHVVTAMDKAIGIHCSYDVGNRTEETDVNITDPGSSDKTRGSPALPDLSLHIVDMQGQERETVALGEILRVQVRMSDENTYGIFVRNLVAKDGSGGNNLTLIDNTGCPVEAKMMREVRTIEPQSKSLEGYLEAFTFTGSSLLELEAEVETCLENCKPVLCQIPTGRRDDDTETVSSFGRRKRSSDQSVLASVTLSKSVAIQADDFQGSNSIVPENYASPVTAPSPIDLNIEGLFHKFGQRPENNEHIFCFDPTMFALLGGGFFLAEICGFSACLIAVCRCKSSKKTTIENKKRHLSIHYGNSGESCSDVPRK